MYGLGRGVWRKELHEGVGGPDHARAASIVGKGQGGLGTRGHFLMRVVRAWALDD